MGEPDAAEIGGGTAGQRMIAIADSGTRRVSWRLPD